MSMKIYPPSYELKKQVVQMCYEYNCAKWLSQQANWVLVSQKLGKSRNCVRNQYRRLLEWCSHNNIPLTTYIDEMLEDNVSFETVEIIEKIPETTFDVLVKSTGMDEDLYEVKSGKIWGNPINLSASFSFTRRNIPTDDQFQHLLDKIKSPTVNKKTYNKQTSNIAVLSIYDVHLEKLAMDGKGLYETKELYKLVLTDLVKQTFLYKPEKLLFIVGNDFGNADNVQGTTTAGTPQQNSVTWRIGIDEQCELIVWAVTQLTEIAPVEIKIVYGNHDERSNYFLGKFLSAWFRNNKNVTIDNEHSYRKYSQYGVTGFMFNHGDSGKVKDYASLMAVEKPLIWANTKYREAHVGHLHKRAEMFYIVNENHGFVVRHMPSLSNTDEWHSKNAYVGNNRGGICGIYNKETGLQAELFSLIK